MYSSSEDEKPKAALSSTRELTGLRKPASDSENSDSGTGRRLRERLKYVNSLGGSAKRCLASRTPVFLT